MKILFVNNFRKRGGGEEFLRDLLPGLAAKGVKVGLICRPGTPLADMFSKSEIIVHPIERSGRHAVSAVFKTAKIIRDEKYEIVDIQRGHDIVQAWLGAKLSGKKPVLMYTPQVPEFIKSRFLLSRMKKVVTISRHIRDRIIAYFPRIASRMSIIYYGIDLNMFKPANIRRGTLRNRFGLSPDTRIIGTVGDLWKNQIEFLDALVLIRREIPDARFALVASESGIGQIEVFKRRASELGLADAVLWTGRLSKDDMLAFYADIDIAVSTHRNEGFGIWVLEALAVGTPVVSVNEGGIRDSLEGCPAGVLVDGGPENMAAEVLRLLNDDALRAKMAAAGPRWTAERFSRERMVEDYFRFFTLLIERGRPTGQKSKGDDPKYDGFEPRSMDVLLMISKNDRYGAQRIFLDQAATLQAMGHRVTVIVRGSGGYVNDSTRSMGLTCYGISMKNVKDILFILRLIKNNKVDIIHTTLDRADCLGVFLSWITHLPVVSTMMVPRCHSGYRFMDKVIVLSNRQSALLRDNGIGPDNISVIRPGIDVERFAKPDSAKREAWKERLRTDRYSVVFCHISSLHARKAHTVSLELVDECRRKGETPLLIIIGDPVQGDYCKSLHRAIIELGIRDNVRFTGWTSEVPEILSLSHFTVLPSEKEALGVVLMEGMAAGTPIIAREGEGGAELIEEYGVGFLYKPKAGISPLADQVVSLLRDSAGFEELSNRCANIAKNEFSLSRFGERLVDMYRAAGAFRCR